VGCIAFADDLSVFLRTSADLKRLIRILHDFAPISGLHINMQKSEVLELGVCAAGCGLDIKTSITVTGIVFSTDKQKMEDSNWDTCHDKIKSKLGRWSGQHLTIIGKANIIRSQVQPLVTFVGGVLDMPDRINNK
jgi:hypothetical protein